MHYVHSSYEDVDRALEAFQYARRALLVIMAVALPFAAWDMATGSEVATQQPAPIQTVKQAQPLEQAFSVQILGEECELPTTRTADAAV